MTEAIQEHEEEVIILPLNRMREQFSELHDTYRSVLPKVDPLLINDLLSRETSTTAEKPFSYTIEVFTRNGIDKEIAKNYIYEKTGKMPSVLDTGTHYVTTQNVTLEILKEISDSDDVVDVRGSYCGGIGIQASYYEHSR
ncbi:MAG: hypothetical protein ACJ72X_15515 [Nitrososphaeraceae archaeon]